MSNDHDDKEASKLQDPSRRQFLKGVGVAGAGAAIADQLLLNNEAKANESQQSLGARPAAGTMNLVLKINGKSRNVSVEPRVTLLNALRNYLDPPLTGPKLVCDAGTCGACTVLMDGKPVYSCLVLAVDAVNRDITTAEGLGSPEKMNAVQSAFVEHDGLMCGFCTPGFVTTLSAYLKQNPNPTLDQVREACKGNFCRCGTYPHVVEAALAAAKTSK